MRFGGHGHSGCSVDSRLLASKAHFKSNPVVTVRGWALLHPSECPGLCPFLPTLASARHWLWQRDISRCDAGGVWPGLGLWDASPQDPAAVCGSPGIL